MPLRRIVAWVPAAVLPPGRCALAQAQSVLTRGGPERPRTKRPEPWVPAQFPGQFTHRHDRKEVAGQRRKRLIPVAGIRLEKTVLSDRDDREDDEDDTMPAIQTQLRQRSIPMRTSPEATEEVDEKAAMPIRSISTGQQPRTQSCTDFQGASDRMRSRLARRRVLDTGKYFGSRDDKNLLLNIRAKQHAGEVVATRLTWPDQIIDVPNG